MSQILLSQQDKHWSNHFIGASRETIQKSGCALTCVSMTSAEFGGFVDPAHIAANIPLFTSQGLINWTLIKQYVPVVTFSWRSYTFNPSLIAQYIVPGKRAVHLEVPTTVGKHWLKVISTVKTNRGIDYLCNNPWTGQQCYALATYGKITGSAHFIKS